MLVSQQPLIGRSHQRVKQQKRRATVTFDVKQVDQVSVFSRYGMFAVRSMTVVFDELALKKNDLP